MKFVSVTIEGISPLLINRFTEETAQQIASGLGRVWQEEEGSPRALAMPKLHYSISGDGTLVIPVNMLYGVLVNAGKYMKLGKSKLTTTRNTMVMGLIDIEEFEVPIQYEKPWEVYSTRVVNGGTGGARIAHRPMFYDWKLSFNVLLEDQVLGVKAFRELVDIAGRRVGLGDFRPDRKGPFGKFKVSSWDVTE